MVQGREIPWKFREMAERELDANEEIRWLDQPKPVLFTKSTIAMVLFGIPWTAFSLFWTGTAAWHISRDSMHGPEILFPLFGVPFILIGLGLLYSPWWNRRALANSVYMITDRRAVIIQSGRKLTIKSYEPDHLDKIYRTEDARGFGSVYFTRRQWTDTDGDRHAEDIGFEGVADSREVEKLLRELADSAGNHEKNGD